MSDTKKEQKVKSGVQIEHVHEENREKIIIHNAFYFKLGLMIALSVCTCILFFFIIQRFEGFANGWHKILQAGQSIIIGLVIAYILSPVMQFWERLFYKFFGKQIKNYSKTICLCFLTSGKAAGAGY